MVRISHWLPAVLLTAQLLAAGCGASSPPSPSPAAASPAAPAVQATIASDERTEIAPNNANASFENAGSGEPAGWHYSEGPNGWSVATSEARTGTRSLRLAGGNQSGTARFWSDPLPIQPGDVIEFQGWTRSEGPVKDGPVLWVETQSEGGPWTAMEPKALNPMLRTRIHPRHWTWQPRGGCLVASEGAVRARVVAECSLDNPANSAWHVDDVALKTTSFKDYRKSHRGSAPQENCMLVVVDTLAADRLPEYGFARGHTPNMSTLAREGTLFENTVTACPWTRPSFGSIFTSLYPSQHTAELANSVLPERVDTLAEQMKAHGYFTAGFVRTAYDGFLGPGAGFGQGFDVFYYSDSEDELFAAVKAFLDRNKTEIAEKGSGGLFLMLHFLEPHSSYINRYPEFLHNEGTLGDVLSNEVIDPIVDRGEDPDIVAHKDMEYARACYDSEVTLVDSRLGELLFRMKQMDLYDRLNIVFTADHGEAFGEKPMVWDHAIPHGSVTQVPLILRFPGKTAPGLRVPELASTLDVMPTLLAALGMPVPPGCEGINLLDPAARPTLRCGVSESKSRGVYEEGSLAIRDDQYKLEVWKAGMRTNPDDWATSRWVLYEQNSPSRWELFDLKADPRELHDISSEKPDVLARLKDALKAHCDRTGITENKAAAPAAPEMSDDARESLKAIGYAGGK